MIALKSAAEATTAEQKRLAETRRNIIVIIHQHLIENGYVEAAERLNHESNGIASKFGVADNIDLNLILSEYESYYEMRFDRKPKLVKKLSEVEELTRNVINKSNKVDNTKKSKKVEAADSSSNKLPTINSVESNETSSLGVSGIKLVTSSTDSKLKGNKDEDPLRVEERLLRPPPQFGGDPELKQLANIISREIYQESPNVKFDDIVHLDEAKRLLIEAVQLPLRFPSLFTGILRPWRGILLHGPPGTGKVTYKYI